MASTFGIMTVTKGTVEKFKFESTDMKARAKVYELAHTHGVGVIYLFKLKKDGFEFVGSSAGIDTPQNPNVFTDANDVWYGLDSKGRLESFPQNRHGFSRFLNPSWY